MRIVKLKQSGPSWHRFRAKGIGGSDACAVMGDVTWTSPDELLAEKVGLRTVEENERMARGKRLEPAARAWYEEQFGVSMAPVCIIHDEYSWLRASLDGLSPDGETILEIKCPSWWSHHKATQGIVPGYYKAQLQHQLLAGRPTAKRIHYLSYFPDADDRGRSFPEDRQVVVLEVLPDLAYQDKLLAHERAFHERVRKTRAVMGKVRKKRPTKKGV